MDSWIVVVVLTLAAFGFGTVLFASAARGVNEARAKGRLHGGWSMDESGWRPEIPD